VSQTIKERVDLTHKAMAPGYWFERALMPPAVYIPVPWMISTSPHAVNPKDMCSAFLVVVSLVYVVVTFLAPRALFHVELSRVGSARYCTISVSAWVTAFCYSHVAVYGWNLLASEWMSGCDK